MGQIEYELSNDVQLDELSDFYRRQGHPTTEQTEKLSRMVDNSFCIVIARDDDRVIGLARGITDGVRGWLVECKLDPGYQGPAAVTRTDRGGGLLTSATQFEVLSTTCPLGWEPGSREVWHGFRTARSLDAHAAGG